MMRDVATTTTRNQDLDSETPGAIKHQRTHATSDGVNRRHQSGRATSNHHQWMDFQRSTSPNGTTMFLAFSAWYSKVPVGGPSLFSRYLKVRIPRLGMPSSTSRRSGRSS